MFFYLTEKNTTKTRSIFALPEQNLCTAWKGGGKAPCHSARKVEARRKSVEAAGRGSTDSSAAVQVCTHCCLWHLAHPVLNGWFSDISLQLYRDIMY